MKDDYLIRLVKIFMPASFLLLVFIVYFFPVIFEESTFFFRDIHQFAYPMKLYLARVWAMGEWPYWYPNLFQGTPLMALMHPGVFYPPSALFLLNDFIFAFNAYFLFHHLVLMLSVYALCRYWERSIWASLCASLTALLGGYFLSLAGVYNQFQSAIWFPLILLTWQKFLTKGDLKYFCGAAVFVAFQVLGGGPENAIFSVLLVYAHSLYLEEDDGALLGFTKKTQAILGLIAISLALSALQWIPTYHLLQEITRGGGFSFDDGTRWSLHPLALLDLFLPENFRFFLEKVNDDLNYMNYFLPSFYMGIIPIFVLTSCLLVGKEQKSVRFWILVFGVGVFFSLGKFNPLYNLFMDWMPLFNLFRFPQKFFFLCAFALVFLIGLSLDNLIDEIINKKGNLKKILSALLVTSMVVAGVFGAHADRAGFQSLVIVFLLALGMLALHFKKVNRIGFFSLLIFLLVMDLMGKNSMLVPLIDKGFYTEPPALAKRLGGTADSYRIYNGMIFKNWAHDEPPANPTRGETKAPSSSSVKPSYNLLDIQLATRDQVYPNLGAIYDLAYVEGSETMMLKSSLLWYDSFLQSDVEKKVRVLKRSNVKYWVTEQYDQPPSIQYPRGIKKVNVFEDALPRAFLVGESRTLPKEKLLNVYYDSAFDPLKQVLLTEKVEMKNENNFSGKVEQLKYSPNRVTLDTTQNAEGMLVLLDTWFPGWKVKVDGNPERIYQANQFYRGVKLGPGDHRIEFFYEPIGLRMGGAISGAASILLLVLFCQRSRRTQ